LDAPISCFPAFPGNEANYLRAQIARIGAATVISPRSYYITEDEEEPIPVLSIGSEFELDNAGLLSVTNWVHHQPHILQIQGRSEWVSMKPAKDDNEDENEDEDKPEEAEEQVETGPKLLSTISEDISVGEKAEAWTIRASTSLSKYSNVVVRSNRWPGSYAFANSTGGIGGLKFANIYVGFGTKYSTQAYLPPFPPAPQVEPSRPTESSDPTVAQEAELEALLKSREPPPESEQQDDEEEADAEEED